MIAPDEFAEVIEKNKITYGEHWKSYAAGFHVNLNEA